MILERALKTLSLPTLGKHFVLDGEFLFFFLLCFLSLVIAKTFGIEVMQIPENVEKRHGSIFIYIFKAICFTLCRKDREFYSYLQTSGDYFRFEGTKHTF